MDRKSNGIFRISARVIWFSSLFMGVLGSISKIMQPLITLQELTVDASIAFLFALSIWYFNILFLPKYSTLSIPKDFFGKRVAMSVAFGVVIMLLVVLVHHAIFPKYNLSSMMMMYQFRGILINLTIFMFIYFLYQSYNTQQVILQYERTKAENLNAQYELLKQQVNPHFLFNSLNTLQAMIDMNDAEASDFVHNLSLFYRFSLENREDDLIQLKKELDILESFIFLLKSRFEEGIEISIAMDEEVKKSLIPPFTLQLLVENCIKHNVVSLEKPLYIKIFQWDSFIVVTNNKQLKINQDYFGIGLSNIKGRFSHVSGKVIEIIDTDEEFTIKLPVIYEDIDHRR